LQERAIELESDGKTLSQLAIFAKQLVLSEVSKNPEAHSAHNEKLLSLEVDA